MEGPFPREKVTLEYESTAQRSKEHRRVKWNFRKSMMNRFRLCRDLVNFSTVSRWLDVGSGTGAFQRMMVGSGFVGNCLGIDLSGPLVRQARERTNSDQVRFRQQDVLELTVEEGPFELLTAIGVLQFTNLSVAGLVTRARELLTEDGLVFFETKHRDRGDPGAPPKEPGTRLRWFYREELVEPTEEAGFTIKQAGGFDPHAGEQKQLGESKDLFLLAEKRP